MNKIFLDNVERLLREKGITKKSFLEDLNLNKNAFSVWRTRKTLPKIETVKKIATYFGLSLDDLFNCQKGGR